MTSITVLIPTHGRPTLLGRTLASLGACRLPAGYGEAVVVENGPKAGAEAVVAEAARAHPALRLRYLHVERANKSHALNEALETVGDGLAVFFDDDVRLDPGVLEAYAEAAEAHPERAYFGGPVGVDYEEEPPAWLVSHLPWSAKGADFRGERPSYYLGFNWAAFVSDLREVGGFDPAFGPGSPSGARGQEREMQQRLRLTGASSIDVSAAVVWHYVPARACTPGWAVQRAYYSGKARGHEAAPTVQARYALSKCKNILFQSVRMVRALPNRNRSELEWYGGLVNLGWEAGQLHGYLEERFDMTAKRCSF